MSVYHTKQELINALTKSHTVQVVTIRGERTNGAYKTTVRYTEMEEPDIEIPMCNTHGYVMYGLRNDGIPLVLDNASFEGLDPNTESKLTREAINMFLLPGTFLLRPSTTHPGKLVISFMPPYTQSNTKTDIAKQQAYHVLYDTKLLNIGKNKYKVVVHLMHKDEYVNGVARGTTYLDLAEVLNVCFADYLYPTKHTVKNMLDHLQQSIQTYLNY